VGNSVSQSNPVFTRTTRFNDLPEDAKKQLEMLEYVPVSLSPSQLSSSIHSAPTLILFVNADHIDASAIQTLQCNDPNTMSPLRYSEGSAAWY
jgi:hypothetical protein